MGRKRSLAVAKYVNILPLSLWLLLLVVIPLLYVFIMGFLTKDTYGGVVFQFSIENYVNVFNEEYLKVYGESIFLGILTTLICLGIAYPFSFLLAQKTTITRTFLMALVIIPSVANSLVRLFGWITLLRKTGVVNQFLLDKGLIKQPLELVYNTTGIVIGLVYLLLMFMIIPLYNSLEKIDPSLIEAAEDLGAKKFSIFREIIFPLSKPGVFAGCVMVFIPSLGYFFVSDVMGGGTKLLMGNLIKNQFMIARNWPLGSAIAIMLILLTLILLFVYEKRGGKMEDLGGR
ncbi:MAG: ABC transporter permease [Enterococcus sp.]